MVNINGCPNCKSNNLKEYCTVPSGELTIEITQGVRVNGVIVVKYHECQNCKLIFQNPRLSEEELNTFYASGYYRLNINQPIGGMEKGEEDRAIMDLSIIKKYVGNIESHLDVGCGLGFLLKMIDAKTKVGIESDINYVKFKDIQVYKSLAEVGNKKYDLVTSIHELEHVYYPMAHLEEMAGLVKSGGYLVIEVPSSKSGPSIFGLPHLSYFEPDVLKLMCKKVGLKVISTEFTPHLIMICTKN